MLTRRNLIGLVVLDVVLFVLANVFSKSNKHPGTVSNVFWYVFLVGVVILIAATLAALVQSRRPKTV